MKSKLEKLADKSAPISATPEEQKTKIKEISEEIKPEPAKLKFTLIVKSPFRKYAKGNEIVDPDEIQKIMSCHESSMVIKRAN